MYTVVKMNEWKSLVEKKRKGNIISLIILNDHDEKSWIRTESYTKSDAVLRRKQTNKQTNIYRINKVDKWGVKTVVKTVV